MRALAFFIGLWCAVAFGQPIPSPVLYAKPGSAPALTVSCPGTGPTSSTINCTLTYTGTAPASATGAWNSTCSGSSTITAFTASGGSGSFTASTPASACAGTLTLTTNIPTSASSGSVTISAPSIWVLNNHAIGVSSNTISATTPAKDCSASNLIVVIGGYPGGGIGTLTGLTDSSSNSWGSPFLTQPGSAGNNFIAVWFLISPTVSAAQTFTMTGTGTFVPTLTVQCWQDTSGTPAFDSVAGAQNNGTTSSVSSINAGSFALTPSVFNGLVISGITSFNTAGPVYTPNSGFTVTDQATPTAQHVGAAAAYLLETTPTVTNPTWSVSPADTGGAATVLFGFKP